ncbi:NCS2 family permease [Micropruina sonneratiae]|uniref:NCS2 family permease n=1 Tax=Micropruina sonneratiae TaxID=2986940 RepID=UPI002225F11E|nr:NCS2 family permease [Micropruina sp. KQZ13P-5]MCW3158913.1 NCS2 family permease [Micropruina sp. KQZ13P-5]
MGNSSPSAPHTDSAAPSGLDGYFEISKRGSTVGREVRGGLVTFFTMAYIIVLNPLIIGTTPDKAGNLITGVPFATATDADKGAAIAAVAVATALIAGLTTILMGAYARFPIALATGLGLNAVVAYTIAPQMTWPQAMGLVVWEGILITVLVVTGFRRAIFNAVPRVLRSAISVGIGLFIAFIGLVDAGVVRTGNPIVQLGIYGSLQGWPIVLFVLVLFLLVVLFVRKVKGAILIAILTGTVLAVIIESALKLGSKTDDNATGWMLNVPTLGEFSVPNFMLLGRVDLFGAFAGGPAVVLGLLLLVFSLLLSDFFDTMGTIVAVGAEGDLLGDDGNPPRTQEILLVDSIAAIAGGVGSVSSNTSYIESAAGVGEGARTGLASLVTGAGFLLSIFLAPLVDMVPSEAAAPALVFVGFLMMSQVVNVDWEDAEQGIPAFFTLALMPFTYSITAGIGAGFISYALIKLVLGKAKQVHWLIYLVAALFVLYFGQGAILALMG